MDKVYPNILTITIILVSFQFTYTQLFSPVNRFQLSDIYLDSTHHKIFSNPSSYFFSLPSIDFNIPSTGSFCVTSDSDTIMFHPYVVGAFEFGRDVAKYLVVQGDVGVWESGFNALVQYSVYSNDTLERTDYNTVQYNFLQPDF